MRFFHPNNDNFIEQVAAVMLQKMGQHQPIMLMKHILRLLSIVLPAVTLSSCYVDGHAHGHVNHSGYRPGYTHTDHYYYERGPAPRRSAPLVNANTNLGLRL